MQVEKKRQRAKRSDAGIARRTGRDAVLMEWMAHMYGTPIDLLQHHLGVGDVRMRELVRRWIGAGWIQRDWVDAGPAWLWPTKGTVNQFLGREVREWKPRPTTAAHTRAVAAVRLHQMGFDLTRWMSERDMWMSQGWRKKDADVPHMPDGVEILRDGSRVLIEVELTAKTRTRYVEARNRDNFTGGLLSDIESRAEELRCGSVAYWCAPHVLPVISESIDEYQQRWEARNRMRERNGHVPLPKIPWYVRSLEEVPKWEVQSLGGQRWGSVNG